MVFLPNIISLLIILRLIKTQTVWQVSNVLRQLIKTIAMPENEDLNEAMLIGDIGRMMRQVYDARARRLGLTRAQWRVLGLLIRIPGCNQAQLAERLEVQPITLTRLLDKLEKSGWVQRRADAKDRRVRRLFLTKKVQPIIKRMVSLGEGLIEEMLQDIALPARKSLKESLKKIRKNLCSLKRAV